MYVFRNESFVMEDNFVEDVSRGASLVMEGVDRSRWTTSVEAPGPQQQQQTHFGEKHPQDNPLRREAKERQEEIYNINHEHCLLNKFKSISIYSERQLVRGAAIAFSLLEVCARAG